MTTILQAYCAEVDRVVTAWEARREYLARKASGRWIFLCDHPDCRAQEVRVICANYWRSADEEETYVAPHYRHLDKHLSGCVHEEGPEERTPTDGRGSASGSGRSSKAGDFIDVFDPGDDDSPGGGLTGGFPKGSPGRGGGRSGGGGPSRDDRSAESKTSFVEDMVDMRNDRRAKLSAAAFDALEVRIKHGRKLRLTELFKHVKNAPDGQTRRIFYGGCELLKPRFGLGFKLKFKDELNGRPVILYVDKGWLADYRFRRSLLDVIDDAEKYTYLTAYAWAVVRWNEMRQQFEVELESLKHLAIYPGRLRGVAAAEASPTAKSALTSS